MTLNEEISRFESIGLDEMDGVKLMDRKECKFTLSTAMVPQILGQLSDSHRILEIDGQRVMEYQSHYYDSPDFGFYTSHQNGKLNRYKVRKRIYQVSGLQFLEVKFKNNKKRTIKKRVPMDCCPDLSGYSKFLTANLSQGVPSLEEKLQVNYSRITLVDKELEERVTIDLNLLFTSGVKKTDYRNMAVIEIKYQGSLGRSKVKTILSEMGVNPLSLSKYCLGISGHYPQVKQNRMKQKKRALEKELNRHAS